MRVLRALLLILGVVVLSCDANGENVEVVGLGECSDCAEHNIQTSHAFNGFGVSVYCRTTSGDVKRRGVGQLDEQGKFKVSIPGYLVNKDGELKESCYAQLHGASSDPCPSLDGIESTRIVSKAKADGGKHVFGPTGRLKFRLSVCTSSDLLVKLFGKPFPLPPFPPIHGKSLHPPIPIYKLPPIPKYHKHLPPPIPIIKKPYPPPVPVYKPKPKPLPPPVPVYKPKPKPLPPPVPVYKPKPKPLPPVYKPKPSPPVYKLKPKPLPPPVPVYKPKPKPLTPPVPVYEPKPKPEPLPPPVPVYKPKPLPPPIPFFKPLPPFPKFPPMPPLPSASKAPAFPDSTKDLEAPPLLG
ncbi:hypothetical protein MLD38_026768 [Melastoma candidum]|uniref:Uncharacterized protein n=1 Tax=Melastoma candidum TaxID=119954 RepID=A0ACB9P169_9MYRT|nr:hypothetical protein MLD38_026768 [Melastoma candidum]